MKTSLTWLMAGGLLGWQGCAVATAPDDVATNRAALVSRQATITVTADTGSAYCATVSVPNDQERPTSRWKVFLDVASTSVSSSSGASLSGSTGFISASPIGQTPIAPGASASFSFCANSPNTTVRPGIVAWNMQPESNPACQTNAGVMPTKAALAVAAGTELGRWDPLDDLTITYLDDGTARVTIAAAGVARCGPSNGCPNTTAILGQQAPRFFVDPNLFNPTTYAGDLRTSFGRQSERIATLTRDNPSALPPAHKLTLVAGPTYLVPGSCGRHYVFQADNPDGTPLTSTQAANLVNALCFYGYGSGCGDNPYVGFIQTGYGCPVGRTCVAIDPGEGDNGSTNTTCAGGAFTCAMDRVYDPSGMLAYDSCNACVTETGYYGTLQWVPADGYDYCIATSYPCHWGGRYSMNRVADPSGVCLNQPCTLNGGTRDGLPGTMQSKCDVAPATCGYSFCIAN